MLPRLLQPLACLALPALGMAQTLYYHTTLNNPSSTDAAVGQDADYVALTYPDAAQAGTLTVILVHVAVDPSSVTDDTGRRWLSGLLDVYPFLAPCSWAAQPPVAVNGYDVDTQVAPAIPGSRLNYYLQALALHTNLWPQLGTITASTQTTRRLPDHAPWPTTVDRIDERFAFATTPIKSLTSSTDQVYSFTALTRNSVVQAANHYGQSWSLTVLDQALQTLNDMLRDQVEFNVTVQAIDVRQPQPGNSKGTIRFRPPAVIHRRSLKAREVAPAALQPSPRWVPWVVGATASSPANVNLYLAPRFAGTASVWIAFPQAYSDLVAQFPTASGFVPVPQSGPAVLWDTVYLVNFAYPAGVSGFTVGIQRTVPGASSQPMPEPVTPIGDFGGAAVVWPYDYQPGLHWPQWI